MPITRDPKQMGTREDVEALIARAIDAGVSPEDIQSLTKGSWSPAEAKNASWNPPVGEEFDADLEEAPDVTDMLERIREEQTSGRAVATILEQEFGVEDEIIEYAQPPVDITEEVANVGYTPMELDSLIGLQDAPPPSWSAEDFDGIAGAEDVSHIELPDEETIREDAELLGIDADEYIEEQKRMLAAIDAEAEAYERKKVDPGLWRQLAYGFESMPTDIDNAALWMESRFPWGEIRVDRYGVSRNTPEEMYGPEFMEMEVDERRQFLVDRREQSVRERYRDVTDYMDTNEGFEVAPLIGSMAGAMATPTTLVIPAGSSYKAMAIIGAAWGGFNSVIWDMAHYGEVKGEHLALSIGAGAILPPAFVATLRGAGHVTRSSVNTLALTTERGRRAAAQQQALNKVYALNDEWARAVSTEGMTHAQGWNRAKQVLGYSDMEVSDIVKAAGKKPFLPGSKKVIDDIAARLDDPKVSAMRAPDFVDQLFGTMHSRISKLSPVIATQLRWFEYKTHVRIHQAATRTHAFTKMLNDMPRAEVALMKKALAEGKFDMAQTILHSRYGQKGVEAFRETRKVMDEFYKELKKAGYDIPEVDNYFPRMIKDLDKLMKTMGNPEKNALRAAIKTARKKAEARGMQFTKTDESDVINKFLRGYIPKEGVPGFTKGRKLRKLSDEMLEAYESPQNALAAYIRDIATDLETRAFFGRLGAKHKRAAKRDATKKGTHQATKDLQFEREQIIQKSLGAVAQREIDSGRLTYLEAKEIEHLLNIRFLQSRKSPHKLIQDLKNLLYSSTLANPISAATQLGDLGLAMYLNGFRNTFKAITGDKHIDLMELGLVDVAAEMGSNTSLTAKILEKTLWGGGFKSMDKFGKNSILNGAVHRYQRQLNAKGAKGERGRKQFMEQWSPIFGKDTPKVMDDIMQGRMTENAKFLLWNELSNLQPISLSEVPEKYLTAPNGRLLYMLKTFTIKQWDIIRNDMIREYKNGSKRQAFKNMAAFTMFFGMANFGAKTTKDFLLGREFNPTDSMMMSAWGLMGVSQYMVDKGVQGKLSEVVTDNVSPPLEVIDRLVGTAIAAATGEEITSNKWIADIPIFGKVLYAHVFGGAEEHAEKMEKKEWQEYYKSD